MGSLKSGIRKLREKLSASYVTLVLEDGTSERFSEADFAENFKVNMQRLRDVHHGTPVSPPHPLGAALVRALPEGLGPALRQEAARQRSIDELVEAKKGRVGPVAS